MPDVKDVVRLQVRLPATLAEELRAVAIREDRSLNSVIIVAARQYVQAQEKGRHRE